MSDTKPPTAPKLAAIRAQIDENLKTAYQRVLTEDVPDRFLSLLAQLREKESAGDKE